MFDSLKSKLLLLVLLIALPGAFTIAFHTYQSREASIDVYKNQAIETARLLAASQTELIQNTKKYLIYLSSVNEVKNPSSPNCGAFLSNILELNTTYINLGVPRADGELICNATPLNRRINVFDRAYFQRSLTERDFAIGTYQLDRAAQKTSVNFSYPVLTEQGEVTGIAVAVVSLDWWSEKLSNVELPNNSIALISDENLSIVANFPVHTDVHGLGAEHYDLTLKASHEYNLSTETITGKDKITRIFTHQTLYKKTDGRTVTVSVGIPIDLALAKANSAFVTNFLSFTAFLCLVTLLAAKKLNSSLLTPLKKITKATAELEEGRFPPSLKAGLGGAAEISILEARFEKMAEARLDAEKTANKRSDELDSVFNALPDLYFRLDKKGTILDYRAASQHDLYTEPTQFMGKRIQDVLPADLGDEFQQKIIDKYTCDKQITWEYSLEIEGELNFFEARINSICHSSEMITVIRNISQRKQNERSLQLAASVFENSSECMTVTDLNGIIIDVNPAFIQVMGYAREELLGLKTSKLSSGRHNKDFYVNLWRTLKKERHWEGEIYNKRKNGDIFPEWLSINAIINDENEVIQYVALYRDISEQKKAAELIWKQAHYDQLTSLPNRNLLIQDLDHEILKAERSGLHLASLFLDLDEFKQINDTLGHDTGDLLLTQVADLLVENTRSQDFIARQGGDEFIIVVRDLPDTNPAIRVADKLIQAFAKGFNLNGHKVYITPSIGISFYPQDAKNTTDLLKTSDQAMYAAKNAGRNCFHCFTQQMQDAAIQRIHLIRDLNLGIQQNQFQLYFQPIISLDTRELLKAEALIRWNHPKKGVIPPDDFIPVAEETRLITKIGNWVFQESCNSLKTLQEVFGKEFQLSLNVSPVQFSDSDQDIKSWPERLRQQQINGSSIVTEITEGLLINNSDDNLSTLLSFRDAGMQVSLDDFGTGYSSLAYIQEYDIDYLKIDRQFVTNLHFASDSYVLCESIIVMAHQLGIKVIAEGVETEEQEAMLKAMGCDYAQGYLFSEPLPIKQFSKLPISF